MHRYRSAVVLGAQQTAARPTPLMRKHHALARRLLDRQDDYLRFTQDWRVPPDNNGCERDIRMTKLNRKYPAACAPQGPGIVAWRHPEAARRLAAVQAETREVIAGRCAGAVSRRAVRCPRWCTHCGPGSCTTG
jgi:Transposase IS66 family